MGSKLISDLQGLVEAILSPGHVERAAAAKRKEAGVLQFTGESRDDVSAEAVAVERSQTALAARCRTSSALRDWSAL
jgi:hypothetical protein